MGGRAAEADPARQGHLRERRRDGSGDPTGGRVTLPGRHERWKATRLVAINTDARDELIWRNQIEPAVGGVRLADLRCTAVAAWVAELARELAPARSSASRRVRAAGHGPYRAAVLRPIASVAQVPLPPEVATEATDARSRWPASMPSSIVLRSSEASFSAIDNGRQLVGDVRDVRRRWDEVIEAIRRLVEAGVLNEIGRVEGNHEWEAREVLVCPDVFAASTGRRAR